MRLSICVLYTSDYLHQPCQTRVNTIRIDIMEIIFIFLAIIFVALIVVHIPFYKLLACQRWRCAEWISWFFVLLLAAMIVLLTLSLASASFLDSVLGQSTDAPVTSKETLMNSVNEMERVVKGTQQYMYINEVSNEAGAAQRGDLLLQPINQFFPNSSQDASKLPNNKSDSVPGTMTAIAIVIAVITLLLSLGTSWLMRELKRIDSSKIQLEKLESKFAEKSEVIADFWKAKLALHEWVEVNAKSADRLINYNKLGIWLEMLMSEDESVRKKAFAQLIAYFPPEEEFYSVASGGAYLSTIKAYSESCHYLHGGTNKRRTWCRIFSSEERRDWGKEENRDKDFL